MRNGLRTCKDNDNGDTDAEGVIDVTHDGANECASA